ncbi:hypothetical protein Tco_0076584, partial [Tanacetum coccineum]
DECNGDKGSVRLDKSNTEGEIGLDEVDEFPTLNASVNKPTLISHGNKLSLIPTGLEEGKDVVIFEE